MISNYSRRNIISQLRGTNWTSSNKRIDSYIQEKQFDTSDNIIFEWISFNQFKYVKEIRNGFSTAIWKDGPLYYNFNKTKWQRRSNKKVILKYLCDPQNIFDKLLMKLKICFLKSKFLNKIKSEGISYGMSLNPYTKNFIFVFHENYFENNNYSEYCEKCGEEFINEKYKWCQQCHIIHLYNNFTIWTSNNSMIDEFIQTKQLKINNPNEVFEWISYNQLNEIKEIGNGVFTAIWKYDLYNKRTLNKKVVLIYLHNLQNISNKMLEGISIGLSQNPGTREYIFVHNNKYFEKYCEKCGDEYTDDIYKWCKPCQANLIKNNFTNQIDDNYQINNFISKEQLKINNADDIVFEWIPYDQFSHIKGVRKGFATAVWKIGLLKYDRHSKEYKREPNKNVVLKYLYNLKSNLIECLNKVKSEDICYGISQSPETKGYILIFHEEYFKKCCENCGEKYINSFRIDYKWCESCQHHKNIKINDFIQEQQQKVNCDSDGSGILFEWVPYSQFNDIKKIGKGGFSTVYSAIWENGPLHYSNYYNFNENKWRMRELNKKVALKCIHNSQLSIDKFLNEVKTQLAYTNQDFGNILKIYGISQNPDTNEFIMVLEYAEGGNLNDYLCLNYNILNWLKKIEILIKVIKGLKEIHQKQMVHRDFHTMNILFRRIKSIDMCISDMGLCGEIGDIDETKIYGVTPYVAPEVLRRKPYTKAADIYSFGMIMYFVATGRQPFSDRAYDKHLLALDICNGTRPEINEPEAPKCYIDLMKRCWDSNPENRPSAIEIEDLILLFYNSYVSEKSRFKSVTKIENNQQSGIKKQFKEAEEYRKANPLSFENIQLTNTQSQVTCTSQSFTDVYPYTECLSCSI